MQYGSCHQLPTDVRATASNAGGCYVFLREFELWSLCKLCVSERMCFVGYLRGSRWAVCPFHAHISFTAKCFLGVSRNSLIACWNLIFDRVTMGTRRNLSSCHKQKSTYSQYVSLRQRLDDLGYHSFLSNDSISLVEKLVADLEHYKELCTVQGKSHKSTVKKVSLSYQHASNIESLHTFLTRLITWIKCP